MKKNQKSVYFYFAKLSCKIIGGKENINYILKSYKKSPFALFISTRPPKAANFTAILLIKTIKSPNKASSKDFFELESNPKKLEFKLSCSENTFFIFPIIEQVLRKIFYILFFKDSGFILHASAAIYQEKAYIFTGLPGAGKSTLAKTLAHSNEFKVFADNNVYIKREGRRFVLYISPFLEWNVYYKDLLNPKEDFPTKSVFVLVKKQKTFVEKMSFREGVNSIAKQIQIPLSSLSKNEIKFSRKLIFEFIANSSDSLYKLYFRKNDPNVIKVIYS